MPGVTARRLHELGQSTEEIEKLLMQVQIMDTLATKLSNVRSAFSGAGNALPLVPQIREALEDRNWQRAGFEEENPLGLSERSESAQTQNPLAYGAGYMGSMLGQYALGSAAMKAIPGVGPALGKAGERLASTGAAQALQRIPVLGELATPQAISGMLGDSILDLGLDTLPMTLRMTGEYLDQQKNGAAPGEEALSIGDILKEAGVNIATNAGFNVLGELAPAALRALSNRFHGRPVMSAAQNAALEKAVRGAELTADEQRMVTRLKEAYPEYVMQRGYTPLEAEEPVILDNMVRQEKAAGNAADELVQAYHEGTLTNAQMETLKPGGANRAAFEQATGMKLPETSSETRRILREGLDNGQKVAYSEAMNSTGGAQGEFTGAERVRGLDENALPVGQGMGFADGSGGQTAGRDSILRGFLSPTENINSAVARTGATPLELRDTTSEPQLFSSALEQARQSNPHGLMVSGKSVEELTQPGTVTFMSQDGLAGALVTANGDIEAVFKNPQSRAKRAGSSLLLNAINNGGTKLDCYGQELVNLYAKHGFEPVAKVAWNPAYAPEGWTYGPQDVFVMKLADGLGIDDITARLGLSEAEGGFHRWTREELDALPVLDYDAALAYRDELIEIGKTDAMLQMPRAQTSAAHVAFPSVMDDASISVSAPVSDLTKGRAVRSAGEPNIPAGMRERGFAESLRTKSDLPDEVKAEFVDTPEVYRQLSNAETIAKADAAWGSGMEDAQRNFRSMLETKDPAAIPLGKNIADELIRQGRSEDAAQLLRDMSAALTSSGQFSQAAAIALMKEDPMTALSYLQKQIDKMNAEGARKFGKKWKDFTLTDEEIKAFGNVPKGDEEALKNLYESVGKRVAKEYPTTMKEKMVELSHIAMLLNPRTQVRNVLSNIAMMPATFTSDKVSALGQKVYSKINPDFKPESGLDGQQRKQRPCRTGV